MSKNSKYLKSTWMDEYKPELVARVNVMDYFGRRLNTRSSVSTTSNTLPQRLFFDDLVDKTNPYLFVFVSRSFTNQILAARHFIQRSQPVFLRKVRFSANQNAAKHTWGTSVKCHSCVCSSRPHAKWTLELWKENTN